MVFFGIVVVEKKGVANPFVSITEESRTNLCESIPSKIVSLKLNSIKTHIESYIHTKCKWYYKNRVIFKSNYKFPTPAFA